MEAYRNYKGFFRNSKEPLKNLEVFFHLKLKRSFLGLCPSNYSKISFNTVDYDKGSDLQCQQPEGQKNKPTGDSDEQVFTQDESTSDTSMTLTTSSNIVDHDNHLEKLTTSSSIVDHASHLETIAGTFSKSHDSTTASISRENPEQITVEKGADLGSQDKSSSVSIEVDASLIRFIKGRGLEIQNFLSFSGSTQKQIEGDFGVNIVLPSSKEDCSIVVEGSIGSVAKASEKITRIIEEAVKSPRLDYSHFISLPLALHPELVEKLIRFQKSILGDAAVGPEDDLEHESNEDATDEEDNQSINQKVSVQLEVGEENKHVKVKMDSIGYKSTSKASILSDMGIEKSIFIKPKTFHLTVLMLKLWNKERIAMAAKVLQKISSKVLDALENQPVSVRLRGLACMKGSPAKARVVHAPVKEIDEEGRLLRACRIQTFSNFTDIRMLENTNFLMPKCSHLTFCNPHRATCNCDECSTQEKYEGKLFSGQVGERYRIILTRDTFSEFMVPRTGGNTTFRRCICPRDSSMMKVDTIIAALQFPCLKKMRTNRLSQVADGTSDVC
ncbi:hypothetical protein ZIOFF_055883 [Zingiber officinale]|uniref:A-kinase anchor protein 7-like phosphoesterase domain-containing protein n=1 Tax=Zingiber officinale TaxID=94328 RepID=A0A8J5FMW3_ZINOF|nr:hypothetical protein ZIOFF_055883 [Zingiber officinale]